MHIQPSQKDMRSKHFVFFPRLPAELRRIIWLFAIPGPRTVTIFSQKEALSPMRTGTPHAIRPFQRSQTPRPRHCSTQIANRGTLRSNSIHSPSKNTSTNGQCTSDSQPIRSTWRTGTLSAASSDERKAIPKLSCLSSST
jgi:hypothetical protein